MTFKTFASGSSGNTYTLTDNEGKVLILDAGISTKPIFREILPSQVQGVLVTHLHKDHSGYVKEYLDKWCKVLLPEDMGGEIHDCGIYRLGPFLVMALAMNHDVPCYGFVIKHNELSAPIFYATDTCGIPYEIEEISLAIIEANFDGAILERNVRENIVEEHRAKRIRVTHNSLSQAIEFITKSVDKVEHIVLAHLSNDNSNGEVFKRKMEEQSGVPTDVARPGLVYEMIRRYG